MRIKIYNAFSKIVYSQDGGQHYDAELPGYVQGHLTGTTDINVLIFVLRDNLCWLWERNITKMSFVHVHVLIDFVAI